jgi:hypothetical protein
MTFLWLLMFSFFISCTGNNTSGSKNNTNLTCDDATVLNNLILDTGRKFFSAISQFNADEAKQQMDEQYKACQKLNSINLTCKIGDSMTDLSRQKRNCDGFRKSYEKEIAGLSAEGGENECPNSLIKEHNEIYHLSNEYFDEYAYEKVDYKIIKDKVEKLADRCILFVEENKKFAGCKKDKFSWKIEEDKEYCQKLKDKTDFPKLPN